MGHVVLLGDSVFDNGAYVGGGDRTWQRSSARPPARRLGPARPTAWRWMGR